VIRTARLMPPSRSHTATPDVRVVIADDHAIVREGLRALVDAQPGLEVVGEAADGQEASERAYDLRPDVLVLDLSMPAGGGVEAAERIQRRCPDVRLLALTMHEERGYVSRVLRAGATGYVLKRAAAAELVRAIRTVAVGGMYIDPSLAGALIIDQTHRLVRGNGGGHSSGVDELTVREGEVLRLVALGHSNKEIATKLEISVKTVETHKASAMARLGLSNRVALVRFAIDQGWLSGD